MISNKKRIIELEGQRGVLQIILLLQKNRELLYGKLYNNKPHVVISNNSTAKRAINVLIKNDLQEADLRFAKNLTIDVLSATKTLYKAKLDPELLEQIKEKYPSLLEKPKED